MMVDQVTAGHLKSQAQQATKKLEIGWMGLIFGDATEKPGNVAAAAIVLAFVALIVVLFCLPDGQTGQKGQAITLFGGIITGAIGFLFGRTTS